MALGLVWVFVPGATPKKPASGLMAQSRPSGPNFIQQMSSPTVSTFQPGGSGPAWPGWSCRRPRGTPRHVAGLALGGGQFDDEHVLGQPALVTGHDRGDAQREALLAEQGVAAVARPVRPDLPGLGEVDDVLVVGVAGPGDVGLAGAQRDAPPSGGRDELAVLPQHLEGAVAHAGHDPHGDNHVGRVGELHADVGDRRARGGPSRTGRRTWSGPASTPRTAGHLGPHLLGGRQLLVGPASAGSVVQMKVRSSTRATSSRGSERDQ
jgi:hypothetical protein